MTFNDRAIIFIKSLVNQGVDKEYLATIMKVSRQAVDKYLSGGSIRKSTIDNLLLHYPEARSQIYTANNEALIYDIEPKLESFQMSVPLIHAYASLTENWDDPEYLQSLPRYITETREGGKYMAFEVRGDSMDGDTRSSIAEGDIIVGKELQRQHWTNRLHIPRIFIIIHKVRGIMVKQVTKHDISRSVITCHSFNQDYVDFDVSLNDITHLFYAKDLKTNRLAK